MSSSASDSSTDRAQFTTPRLVPVLLVGVAVLVVVVAEAREAVAAVDGPVAYCGLCHLDWKLAAMLLLLGVSLSALVWAGLRYRPSL